MHAEGHTSEFPQIKFGLLPRISDITGTGFLVSTSWYPRGVIDRNNIYKGACRLPLRYAQLLSSLACVHISHVFNSKSKKEVIEGETFYSVGLKAQPVGVAAQRTEEQNWTRAGTQRTHIQNRRVRKWGVEHQEVAWNAKYEFLPLF